MGAAAAVLGPGPAGVGPSSSSELFRSIAAVTLGRDAEKFWEGGTYSGRQRYMSMHMCMHMYVQYVQSLADCSHGDSHVGSVSPAATRTRTRTRTRTLTLTLTPSPSPSLTLTRCGISERQAARRTTPADTRCHKSAQRAGSTEHTD